MFFSNDERSLVRGKRKARRTDTCRPCLIEYPNEPGREATQGVVLDITPYGMLIRSVEKLPIGEEITVQLMRDEAFRHPLAPPRPASVVRYDNIEGEFVDHGVELIEKPKQSTRRRAADIAHPAAPESVPVQPDRTRMHTLDITIGGAHKKNRR
jgi:hypothetical protein